MQLWHEHIGPSQAPSYSLTIQLGVSHSQSVLSATSLRTLWQNPERSHQFAKYLHFGGEGGTKTNNPAEQAKAVVYNELVSNAVAVQTVADQTHALHELRRRGVAISTADLSYFSPYPTSRVKRFGQYPTRIKAESGPPTRNLPSLTQSPF